MRGSTSDLADSILRMEWNGEPLDDCVNVPVVPVGKVYSHPFSTFLPWLGPRVVSQLSVAGLGNPV
jgi:hypothetical protein